jgi:small neutral amino acid transporter SnatA (MarC family)
MQIQEQRNYTPFSVGDWLVTMIVIATPLVGLIMQLVWAFSSDTHPSKKSFCQAGLILFAIFFVLAVGGVLVLGGLGVMMSASQPQGGTL